ncbi:AraC family transcriptional regulator [Streptomyces sp. NPDC088794]|uniref:helix-turn-helix transcriptional regulator n=1 Tax=Streptomyces sp. NPDC088794 TaxID=3365902 RepID=UPI00381C6EEC
MAAEQEVTAWRPRVPGVVEVFHAHFTEYAYPMHVHEAWTLLIVDDGAVRYDLDRHEHGTPDDTVTLLPPHVPHNGAAATPDGFRKRVVYLDGSQLPHDLIGAAVDGPDLRDPLLRLRVGQLHTALTRAGEELEAESRLTFIGERLRERLRPSTESVPRPDPVLARRLRELLDAHVVDGLTLDRAGALLHAHPAHLVRAFSTAYGIAPHQYLMSRRVDRARRLLLDGRPASEVAPATGFFDQPHLTRHFRKLVGVTPGQYAKGRATTGRAPAERAATGRATAPVGPRTGSAA